MMNRELLLTTLKNLAWLMLVAYPVFFLLIWVQGILGGAERSRDLGYVLETGGFYYLAYVLYVLVGGLLHHLLTLLVPRSWKPIQRRITVVLLTPVIPLLLIVMGERVGTVSDFLVPLVVVLMGYGLAIKLPGSYRPRPLERSHS